jgi:hypothetical protein
MSRTVIVRYQARTPEAAEQNQSLVENVFTELAEQQPAGLRYASFRLADGRTFVHVAVVEGSDNPLDSQAAFQEFQRNIRDRIVGPPEASEAILVGSYGLLDNVLG